MNIEIKIILKDATNFVILLLASLQSLKEGF